MTYRSTLTACLERRGSVDGRRSRRKPLLGDWPKPPRSSDDPPRIENAPDPRLGELGPNVERRLCRLRLLRPDWSNEGARELALTDGGTLPAGLATLGAASCGAHAHGASGSGLHGPPGLSGWEVERVGGGGRLLACEDLPRMKMMASEARRRPPLAPALSASALSRLALALPA